MEGRRLETRRIPWKRALAARQNGKSLDGGTGASLRLHDNAAEQGVNSIHFVGPDVVPVRRRLSTGGGQYVFELDGFIQRLGKARQKAGESGWLSVQNRQGRN